MFETAKAYKMGNKPLRIDLKGDPTHPESAQQIITFPGGSIEVCRTSDNEYWVHIEVHHHGEIIEEGVRQSKHGRVVDSRLDYIRIGDVHPEILEIPNIDKLHHLAVRIRTTNQKKGPTSGQ